MASSRSAGSRAEGGEGKAAAWRTPAAASSPRRLSPEAPGRTVETSSTAAPSAAARRAMGTARPESNRPATTITPKAYSLAIAGGRPSEAPPIRPASPGSVGRSDLAAGRGRALALDEDLAETGAFERGQEGGRVAHQEDCGIVGSDVGVRDGADVVGRD